jgi:glycerophosphoryl diester phosphodiesterase
MFNHLTALSSKRLNSAGSRNERRDETMSQAITEKPVLIHHAAKRDHDFPNNSLSAIKSCLLAGARMVEIDCLPLKDGDFALLHDADLAQDTNGKGQVVDFTADQVRQFFYLQDGKTGKEPVAVLSRVVQQMENANAFQRLQIDLKAHFPLTEKVLHNLLDIITPVKERVLISSVADWALRSLRRLDPQVVLGFDPLLYLDLADEPCLSDDIPPFRMGAYGYRDDHPLSTFVWGKTRDYLERRAEALLVQCSQGEMWFIKAQLLLKMLEDDFDWVAFLAEKGIGTAAWTLDADSQQQVDAARRLINAGVSAITTNQPTLLAKTLDGSVEY